MTWCSVADADGLTRGHAAQVVAGYVHRREWRVQVSGLGEVVESRYGDVGAHQEASPAHDAIHRMGNEVAAARDGLEVGVLVYEQVYVVPTLTGIAAAYDEPGRHLETGRCHLLAIYLLALASALA